MHKKITNPIFWLGAMAISFSLLLGMGYANEAHASTELYLNCVGSDANSIEVSYETVGADDADLFLGDDLLFNVGSGDNSGTHTEDGLDSDTSYTFHLIDGALQGTVTCMTQEEDPDPSGTLSCGTITTDSIQLEYSTTDANDAHLFRGSSMIHEIGAGDNSGTYTETGLNKGTTYTFYLRDGSSASDTQLNSVSCTTQEEDPDPSGSISCGTITTDSIQLEYSTTDANDAHLFRGSSMIHEIGAGDNSGTYTESGLNEGTTYTFYLRDGSNASDTQLDSVSCTTKEDDETYITANKKVGKEGTGTYYESLDVSPDELLTYSIKIEAHNGDAEEVVVTDNLSARLIYEGNLRADGSSISGNIEDGVDIGDILEGESKTITFDARVAPRDEFLIGTTTITNVVSISAIGISASDSASINVERESKVTEVPAGITGNKFFDYFAIPFLLALAIFFLFRKHIISLIKRVENTFLDAKEEWSH